MGVIEFRVPLKKKAPLLLVLYVVIYVFKIRNQTNEASLSVSSMIVIHSHGDTSYVINFSA